jgi:hypothetical protein
MRIAGQRAAHRQHAHLVAVFLAEHRDGALATASSWLISRVSTGALARMRSLTAASTATRSASGIGTGWLISKRSRSGAPASPSARYVCPAGGAAHCAADGSPNGWRGSPSGAHGRHPAAPHRRPAISPSSIVASWTNKRAELLLRIADRRAALRPGDDAGIADLAAGFAIERRLVDQDHRLLAHPALLTSLPSATIAVTWPSAVSVS